MRKAPVGVSQNHSSSGHLSPDNFLTGRTQRPGREQAMSVRFRIVFASACAVLVAVLCALYGRHVRGEAERMRQESIERYGGEVVRLVVATGGLEAGEVVGYSNVTERDWLVDLAPDGAISSIDDVLGLRVSVPVAAGAPLTELNVRDDSSLPDVPAGLVAVSLPLTDRLGLSRGVVAGSRLLAYEVSDGSARLISGEVQVVSAPLEQTGLVASSVVTVAAPPDDVAALLAASASGDLRLTVPASDVKASDVVGAAEVEVPEARVVEVAPHDEADSAGSASDVPSGQVVVDEVVDEEVDA